MNYANSHRIIEVSIIDQGSVSQITFGFNGVVFERLCPRWVGQ